jgi:hypothetical protein
MEFADNNRISHRQLYRQMLLALAGPLLLGLFSYGRTMGINGLAGILAAAVVLLFDVIFLVRLAPDFRHLEKSAGNLACRAIGVFFLVYILLAAAYLLSLLEEILPVSLVDGISGRWLSFFAVLVCSLGTHWGMQRRGRAAEVAGGIFLAALALLLLLSIGQGNLGYLQEAAAQSALTRQGFLENAYSVVCGFSGISLLPFALEHVEKQESSGRTMVLAILTLVGLLAGMVLVLPAVFGWKRLQTLEYPVIPLLAGADLPGDVLARFDVLWMGFLLYSILFGIGSLFHYGHQIIRKSRLGTGRFWMAAAAYLLSVLEFNGAGIEAYFGRYLAWIFVPGTVLIQLLMMLKNSRKRKRKAVTAGVVSTLLFLTGSLGGCAGIEPEKRMFPLALGADMVSSLDGTGQEELLVTFGMPDQPQASGQEKTGEESNLTLAVQGSDFSEILETYDRTQEKYLDMGHLQVLILGNSILQEERYEAVLKYLEQEPYVGEDLYVFSSEDAAKVLNWQSEQGTSVGEYLRGILENRIRKKQEKAVTLRDVYYSWYQNGSLPELPVIRFVNDELLVDL